MNAFIRGDINNNSVPSLKTEVNFCNKCLFVIQIIIVILYIVH